MPTTKDTQWSDVWGGGGVSSWTRLHLAAAKPSSVSIKQLHFVAFNFLNVEWEWQAKGSRRAMGWEQVLSSVAWELMKTLVDNLWPHSTQLCASWRKQRSKAGQRDGEREKMGEREGETERGVHKESSRAAINTDCYIISIVSWTVSCQTWAPLALQRHLVLATA